MDPCCRQKGFVVSIAILPSLAALKLRAPVLTTILQHFAHLHQSRPMQASTYPLENPYQSTPQVPDLVVPHCVPLCLKLHFHPIQAPHPEVKAVWVVLL
jgi:hypothetical protein